jgi:hypothetical protein
MIRKQRWFARNIQIIINLRTYDSRVAIGTASRVARYCTWHLIPFSQRISPPKHTYTQSIPTRSIHIDQKVLCAY